MCLLFTLIPAQCDSAWALAVTQALSRSQRKREGTRTQSSILSPWFHKFCCCPFLQARQFVMGQGDAEQFPYVYM